MNKGAYFYKVGLTNWDSESLENLASSRKVRHVAYCSSESCSGRSPAMARIGTIDRKTDQCPRCDYYLFWKTEQV